MTFINSDILFLFETTLTRISTYVYVEIKNGENKVTLLGHAVKSVFISILSLIAFQHVQDHGKPSGSAPVHIWEITA